MPDFTGCSSAMSEALLERRIERLWQESAWFGWLLQPVALLFGLIVALRRTAYRRGWLRSLHPGVPVIVVGSIRVGGTGKTPVVAWLASELQTAGLQPVIITRGYGGAAQAEPVVATANSDARMVGDEAVLLARRTQLRVVVCTDRVAAARHAVELGAGVIIADDGMQHYALARDLEIAVVDGRRRFGNGRLLPAGPLREPPQRLRGLPLVLCQGEPWEPRMLSFSLRATQLTSLLTGEVATPQRKPTGQVMVVAGIGDPERFLQLLHSQGLQTVPVPVPDHGRVDLERLRQESSRPIVMTEKDAVKYRDCRDPDAWYLPVELQLSDIVRERILAAVAQVTGSRSRAAGSAA